MLPFADTGLGTEPYYLGLEIHGTREWVVGLYARQIHDLVKSADGLWDKIEEAYRCGTTGTGVYHGPHPKLAKRRVCYYATTPDGRRWIYARTKAQRVMRKHFLPTLRRRVKQLVASARACGRIRDYEWYQYVYVPWKEKQMASLVPSRHIQQVEAFG